MSSVPLQPGGTFNDRRNTSRVFWPPPGAFKAAVAACQAFARANPAHAAWVADGAKPIRSDTEHRARFGGAYEARSRDASRTRSG